MHIVPVLFAVMFIIVAQQNDVSEAPVVNKSAVPKPIVSGLPLLSVLPVNAANANHLITFYKLSCIAYKVVR
jgi:hypothetical protein